MSDFVPVKKSSNVDSVRYDAATQEFHVKFKRSDTVYIWEDVTQSEYDAFLKAESPGSHLFARFPASRKHRKQEPKKAA